MGLLRHFTGTPNTRACRVGPARSASVRRFQTTRWGEVLQAAHTGGESARSFVFERYWHPVHSFFRSQGVSSVEADDLTQGLFAEIHRRQDLQKVDPARGRFRSWLCACAKHHLYVVRDRERSIRAGGGRPHESLDATAILSSEGESSELHAPDKLFDAHWARQLVTRSLARLRDHYVAEGQQVLFDCLVQTLSGEGSELRDAELAAMLRKSEGALRVDRHRLKKDLEARYRRILRDELRQTVSAAEVIDDEIRYLLAALG